MAKRSSATAAVLALILASAAARADEKVAEVLQRQSQELLDAISSGDAAIWERYLDPDARYVDEGGEVLSKKDMVDGIKPLPEGVSGTLRVTEFAVAVHDNVAVATHIADEDETYHGHKLRCRYRSTETWKKGPAGWRLIAGQVVPLRTDPPSIPIAAARRAEYCGRYSLAPEFTYEIRCNGDSLEGLRTGGKPEKLRAEAPDVLFVPGRPRYRYVFQRDHDGRITGFAQRREAWDLVWRRSD